MRVRFPGAQNQLTRKIKKNNMLNSNELKEGKMRYKIGVMGKAGRSKDIPKILKKNARTIGKEIAKQGCILITGACMGVPDIAAKAAGKAGGLVLGYSPVKTLKEHIEPPISYPRPSENIELIFTGYGKVGRNILSIFECDGVILIGGGIGTLNEFSMAAHEGKVIGILEGMDGVVEELLAKIEKEGDGKGGKIIKDRNPKRLVKRVTSEIKEREEKPRAEVPITFKNERGKELVGILHLPEKEKPPLVVICHGFDGSKTRKNSVELCRALQKEGIAAFRFDFEGCGDSEGNFEEMTLKKEASDLDAALRTVLKEGDFNSKNIALIGHSLGAVVITSALKNFKFLVKTLVFWGPAFNQKELFRLWFTEKEIQDWQKNGYLIKEDTKIGKDYFRENRKKDWSFLLSEISLPILVIHGEKDEDVPLKFSQQLLKKYKNIKLEVLSGADHKLADFLVRSKLVEMTCEWLKEHL